MYFSKFSNNLFKSHKKLSEMMDKVSHTMEDCFDILDDELNEEESHITVLYNSDAYENKDYNNVKTFNLNNSSLIRKTFNIPENIELIGIKITDDKIEVYSKDKKIS